MKPIQIIGIIIFFVVNVGMLLLITKVITPFIEHSKAINEVIDWQFLNSAVCTLLVIVVEIVLIMLLNKLSKK